MKRIFIEIIALFVIAASAKLPTGPTKMAIAPIVSGFVGEDGLSISLSLFGDSVSPLWAGPGTENVAFRPVLTLTGGAAGNRTINAIDLLLFTAQPGPPFANTYQNSLDGPVFADDAILVNVTQGWYTDTNGHVTGRVKNLVPTNNSTIKALPIMTLSEPAARTPGGTEPSMRTPGGCEPSSRQPSGTEPASRMPGGIEPSSRQPGGVEPAAQSL